jgi:hypothetical protein
MIHIDGLSWQQFASLPNISKLPLSEQIRQYNIYTEQILQESILMQQMYNQDQVIPSVAGGGIDEVVEEGLPSGCIEFTYNTTGGTNAQFSVTTSALTNYTITWGDGTEVTDVIDGGVTIEHEYADSDTEYTVRLCFDDASLVTELDLED